MDFLDKLKQTSQRNNSLLCVGLDPDASKMPAGMNVFDFLKEIVDATADLVCAFKPNSAFFEASGSEGVATLKKVCDYLHENYPDVPIILDFKRGDIGHTNEGYARYAFDYLDVHAITIQPYLGRQAVQPFLDYKERGIIVLCRTSNPGAGEFQDLIINDKKLYHVVAEQVKNDWNANNNCLLVVGATYPEEAAEIRRIVGDDMTFLVPGIGAQGGDIEATVQATMNGTGEGIIVNASRSVLYASSGKDFAEAARTEATKLRDEINKARRKDEFSG